MAISPLVLAGPTPDSLHDGGVRLNALIAEILGPNGDGSWTAYTPAVSAQTGTFTAAAGQGLYFRIGKTVFLRALVSITTNGTASVWVNADLPFPSKGLAVFSGREVQVTGLGIRGTAMAGATSMYIRTDNNAYPGADNAALSISGFYETT